MTSVRPLLTSLSVLVALSTASPLAAVDFVVTRYGDPPPDGCEPDDCSLREAVIAANATDAPDRILLSAGTYQIQLQGADENFSQAGDLDLLDPVEIRGVGAGITQIDGSQLFDPVISTLFDGPHLLADLTIFGNVKEGLFVQSAATTVERCGFLDNASDADAASVRVSIDSHLTLRDSTISGSISQGLVVSQGGATLENVTISEEIVRVSNATSFTCTHCTVVGPPELAGSPTFRVRGSDVTLVNSIVVGECELTEGATIDSSGGNLESPGDSCTLDQATDQPTTSALALKLGPLSDNGGPTPTRVPGAGGAAVGAADDALCLPSDQRGVARSTDCESGAVERRTGQPDTPIFLDGFEQGDGEAWSDEVGTA